MAGQPCRQDFVIKCEGLDIRRIYLAKLPDGDRFVWSINVNDHAPEVPGVPISGWAATLDRRDADELWTDAREGRAAQAAANKRG